MALPAKLAIDAGNWSLAVVPAVFIAVGLLGLTLAEVASRFDITGARNTTRRSPSGR